MKRNDGLKFGFKVAVVGCGGIAVAHIRYLKKYLFDNAIAVCDKDLLRLDSFSKNFGIEHTYQDLDEMLEKFSPDIIHILTPPQTHAKIALQCLKKGCHVLIEKPMCVLENEAQSIIEAALMNKKLVCIDHMRLYDPFVISAKELIERGEFGKIINVSAEYSYDYFQRISVDPAVRWIENLPGGIFFDVMPHPLCLIDMFLPGLTFEKSLCSKNEDGVVQDMWCLFLSKSSTGSLHMSLRTLPLKNRLIIECEKGEIEIDLRNFLVIIKKKLGLPNAIERIIGNIKTGNQVLFGTIKSMFNFARGRLDPYAGLERIIVDFYGAIKSGGASPVPPEKAKELLLITKDIFNDFVCMPKKNETVSVNEFGPVDFLVTGATGFIGRRVVNRLLSEGYTVRVLTHRSLSASELADLFIKEVQVIQGDIYDSQIADLACRNVLNVYHLAAAMKGSWHYHLDTTITGTKNIIVSAAKSRVKRFIYVSTLNVYDAKNYPHNGVIDENFDYEKFPQNRGNYSHAKLRAEKFVREFSKSHDLPIDIFRPGLVYGPNGKIFPQDVGYRIGKDLVIVFGMGMRKIPFVYVDNLVDALLLAVKNKLNDSSIFNVVDDDYPTQRQFIRKFKDISGEKLSVVFIPMFFLQIGIGLLEWLAYVIFKKNITVTYKLKCISINVTHSTKRVKEVLGWKQRVSFEEGLMMAVKGDK